MTPEEIEAKRIADEQMLVEEMKQDEISQMKDKLAKAEEDRDNYKNVALKRLGKLPGDAEFLQTNDNEFSVAEQVKLALLDNEVEKTRQATQSEVDRMRRENAELRLAIKNRPGSGMGGDSGSASEVKDNVFSGTQIEALKVKAKRLNIDPEKYIQNLKQNLLKRS